MKDARGLRLIGSIFETRTILEYYTLQDGKWKIVNYVFLEKLRSSVWVY